MRTRPKAPPAKQPKRGKVDPIPVIVHPELATLVDAPFDDDEWLFETKWDGFRAIGVIDAGGRVTLTSRSGKDLLARFPELASIGASFDERPVVVDGEIVTVDREGRSSFQGLQNAAGKPLTYVVFDVLYAGGRDLRDTPLEQRKDTLDRIVVASSKSVRVSRHVLGKGRELFELARTRGLEGIVGKRRDAPYVEARTRDWVKIKAQLEQECVIAGYTDPRGARSGFGSLILGLYDHGRLTYCGKVGTGFDGQTLSALAKKLGALASTTCPFARRPKGLTHGHWVAPKLVAQVRFTEWTHDGSMRHPAFLGLRDDKRPADCRRERPIPASDVA